LSEELAEIETHDLTNAASSQDVDFSDASEPESREQSLLRGRQRADGKAARQFDADRREQEHDCRRKYRSVPAAGEEQQPRTAESVRLEHVVVPEQSAVRQSDQEEKEDAPRVEPIDVQAPRPNARQQYREADAEENRENRVELSFNQKQFNVIEHAIDGM